MDIFTVIIGTILALFLLYVIMRMSYVMMRNVIVGMEFRKNLARKVDSLRLNKMLAALGIDINNYLHSERVIDIEEHIDKCSACENTDICDNELAKGNVQASNIDYCNNEESLQHIVATKPAQES
jgi:accessory gene regulator protein AgrB